MLACTYAALQQLVTLSKPEAGSGTQCSGRNARAHSKHISAFGAEMIYGWTSCDGIRGKANAPETILIHVLWLCCRHLDRHLDADEAVVLGAGLFAANLSSSFRLRVSAAAIPVPL